MEAYSFTKSAPGISGIECLTSLCLTAVNITGEMVEQFLSICPLLERLSLIQAMHISNLRIVGSSLKLKYLNIEFCFPLESIHIFAPNLESLHFHRPLRGMTKLQVEGLCRLVDLHVEAADISYELTQFSSYFPQLETFTMDFDYDEIYLEQPRLSQFTKLRHLIFKIKDFLDLDMSGLYEFIYLSCPYLHKFTVEMSQVVYDGDEEVSLVWGNRLRHQFLKVLEIIMFVGKRYEIKLAKCFLKTAIKLEKLIIDTRCQYSLMMHPDDDQHDEYKPGSRKRAEKLRKMVPPGVELLIL